MRLRPWLRGVACSIMIAGCVHPRVVLGQNANQPKSDQTNQQEVEKQAAGGEKVYMDARCFACHGQDGFGGVGPRFRQDHFLGMTDYVAGQILIGRGVMPSFAELSDQQVADVATYIRNSWGNSFGVVHPQDVAQVRNELKTQPRQNPHVSSHEQPQGVPAPPPGGQPPGQPLPPANMR